MEEDNHSPRSLQRETSESKSTNVDLEDIDEETAKKLRGDAIGETMYSESFVIKTLTRLSRFEFSESLEEDLCFLWDMTTESDVCEFLSRIEYKTCAYSVILNHPSENRYIEIVIGIWANMLCAGHQHSVTDIEVKLVLNLLESYDAMILIQIVRFIHGLAHLKDKLPFFDQDHIDKLGYILNNSTNVQLLLNTFKAVHAITVDMKLSEDLIKADLLKSMVAGYQVFWEKDEERCLNAEKNEIVQATNNLMQCVCNLCAYVENSRANNIKSEITIYFEEFVSEIVNLFDFCSREDDCFCVSDFKYYMEALVYIFKVFDVTFNEAVLTSLCNLLLTYKEQSLMDFQLNLELLCYFLAVADENILKEYFKKHVNFKPILTTLKELNLSFDFKYEENLINMLQEL